MRVLELPGLATAFAGKCLADLGAEVIRVVPPAGDPLQSIPPHVPAGAGHDTAAAALACNEGKHVLHAGLTDAEVLARARAADVVLHELTDAELEPLGLDELRALPSRGGIVAAITPFGAAGPLSAWRGSDLVLFAMGGYLYMTGEREDKPLMVSAPMQPYLHGGLHAACAVLAALRRRRLTGQGAAIDQSIRDTITWMLTNVYAHWDMLGVNLVRNGSRRDMGTRQRLRTLFEASDGWLVWMFTTGHLGAPSLRRLMAWMAAEGFDLTEIDGLDWDLVDLFDADLALLHRVERVFGDFLRTRTKAELLRWATGNGLMLAPVATIAEVRDDEQLRARKAWREARPGGVALHLPGPPVRVDGVAWVPQPDCPDGPPPAWPIRPGVTAPPPRPAPPLAGIRVLDLGSTLAAPIVGRHLASLGAEVIKVESATHPDTLRVSTPYPDGLPGLDRSGYFAAYNAGKKSVTLNLREPAAVDVLRRLVERADVLLENYAPGVMERLGLGARTLQAWNPRLVVASHSLSGQTGPRSVQRGYGQVAGGLTGWYDLTGEEGGPPIGPYSAYTDFLSWPYLLAAILVALEVRDQSGRAPAIDHAQIESSLHFLAPLLIDHELTGRMATRHGNRREDLSPNDVYPCAGEDRWLALTVTSDADWAAACDVLELPAGLAQLCGIDARRAHAGEIDAAIAACTRRYAPEDLAAALQVRGVPAGSVHRAQDLFADPQLAHRGVFVRRRHAELGDHAVITPSFRIDGVDLAPATAAPLLGEHTFEVLTALAALSADEVATLAAAPALT